MIETLKRDTFECQNVDWSRAEQALEWFEVQMSFYFVRVLIVVGKKSMPRSQNRIYCTPYA